VKGGVKRWVFPAASKACKGCNEVRRADEFYKRSDSGDGLQTRCIACVKKWQTANSAQRHAYSAAWKLANPEKAREYGRTVYRRLRLKSYGLDEKSYSAISAHQGNCCAICKSKTNGNRKADFHIDHDHVTNAVRGLLCFRCNAALGLLADDPSLLARAIEYLTEVKPWAYP
jgi:hypothetical protein